LDKIKSRIEEIELMSSNTSFWEDRKNAQKLIQELSDLKDKIEEIENMKKLYDELLILYELSSEDVDFQKEFEEKLKFF
jgi:protein subunit release factor A